MGGYNLDGDGSTELVALREQTGTSGTGPGDLMVAQAFERCRALQSVAIAHVSDPNEGWADVAVGDFDGTGKQIAVVQRIKSNVMMYRFSKRKLTLTHSIDITDLVGYSWARAAAGDLDGDRRDELVVAAQVADGRHPTIVAYKWSGSGFSPFASATFGNTGNSTWLSIAVGDFNGDGRASIALLKNAHSNFSVFGYPGNGSTLTEQATEDLDSASGQPWRSLAAVDWVEGDRGARELLAVRSTSDPYRANLFVYGNRYHRLERESSLEETKAVWQQRSGNDPELIKKWLTNTHANTVGWSLGDSCDDYPQLVEFLEATKSFAVDGRQLRVWLTLLPGSNAPKSLKCDIPHPPPGIECSMPRNPDRTPWNEYSYFKARQNGNPNALCTDFLGWSNLVSALARQYPHLVSFGIDDLGDRVDDFTPGMIAQMESQLRSFAPWMTFVPTVYYGSFFKGRTQLHPDLARTFDTMIYFFRNELRGPISLADNTVENIKLELAGMSAQLPVGRKLLAGMYFNPLYSGCDRCPCIPSPQYDHHLVNLLVGEQRSLNLGGLVAYDMQCPVDLTPSCSSAVADPCFANVEQYCCSSELPCCSSIVGADENCSDADALVSRYCALQKAYGADFCAPGQTRTCDRCGIQTCTAECTWSATCSGQGACDSGQVSSERGCGNCGHFTDICSKDCQWTHGTICEAQGVCTPGETSRCCECGLKKCSCVGEKVCKSSCTWGSCEGDTCGSVQCK